MNELTRPTSSAPMMATLALSTIRATRSRSTRACRAFSTCCPTAIESGMVTSTQAMKKDWSTIPVTSAGSA